MSQLEDILERAVADGCAPGIVAAAITPRGERLAAAAGVRESGKPHAMTADTVFWIASCTKAITTAAAMQLVEKGAIGLDDPLGPIIPALAHPRVLKGYDAAGMPITRPARTPLTLRHLLTHMSGLAYDFFSPELTAYLRAVDQSVAIGDTPDYPLIFEPGEGWQYGVGIDWAGQVIQAVSDQPLADYMDAHVFKPLGMTDSTFFPREDQSGRRAAVHRRVEGGGFVATPFGMPPEPHFMMGGGGLFSTVTDYMAFIGAILGEGASPGGARILKPQTVARMRDNHIGNLTVGPLQSANALMTNPFEPMPGVTKRWGLGFLINEDPGPAGRSAGSLAWAGLANCYYWIDPGTGAAGVMFAQVLPFADERILGTFETLERAVYAN